MISAAAAVVADVSVDVVASVAVVDSVAMLVIVDEVMSVALSTSEWLFSISLSLSLYNLTGKHNYYREMTVLVRINIYKFFAIKKDVF